MLHWYESLAIVWIIHYFEFSKNGASSKVFSSSFFRSHQLITIVLSTNVINVCWASRDVECLWIIWPSVIQILHWIQYQSWICQYSKQLRTTFVNIVTRYDFAAAKGTSTYFTLKYDLFICQIMKVWIRAIFMPIDYRNTFTSFDSNLVALFSRISVRLLKFYI